MSKLSIQASATICALAVASNFATLASAAPPLVRQLNNGNWLPQREAQSLRDEMFYRRAIFAYQMTQPLQIQCIQECYITQSSTGGYTIEECRRFVPSRFYEVSPLRRFRRDSCR